MDNQKNELGLFNNQRLDFWPQSFLSNIFDGSFWDNFGFGGFNVDVKENADAYIIDAEMPGLSKEDIAIDINGHMLTISAQLNENNEQKDENGRYLRRERHTGSFKRSFSLEDVNTEEINAEMENGVLTIRCPKKTPSVPNSRRVQIQ